MKSSTKAKDCFGLQGETMLHGEPADDCLECEQFDRCHKVTMASTLQCISMDLGLITQNGLEHGWLKSFNELEQGREEE